jgi:hypothetical protein
MVVAKKGCPGGECELLKIVIDKIYSLLYDKGLIDSLIVL